MKTLRELAAEKRLKQEEDHKHKRLVGDLGGSFDKSTSRSSYATHEALEGIRDHWDDMSREQKEEMKEMMQEMTGSITKSRSSLSMPVNMDVESITVQALSIPALTRAMDKLCQYLEDLNENIQNIKVESPDIHVPEIKLPTINIPEIKMPEIKIPETQVNLTMPQAKTGPRRLLGGQKMMASQTTAKEEARVVEEKMEYDKDGNLESIIEIYSDGTKRVAKGFNKNKVTYEYN